jgi:hypothetical protein
MCDINIEMVKFRLRNKIIEQAPVCKHSEYTT